MVKAEEGITFERVKITNSLGNLDKFVYMWKPGLTWRQDGWLLWAEIDYIYQPREEIALEL